MASGEKLQKSRSEETKPEKKKTATFDVELPRKNKRVAAKTIGN